MATRRVLLVEDDTRVREMLRDVIAASGYDVQVAAEGETGFLKFQQQPVDLVITDLMMPGIDGLQLAARLRGLDPAVPIILLTGFATPDAVERARRLGLTTVSKPIGVSALKSAIAAAIGPR
jgi:DNA-binding response OmpR family regulator